MRFQVRQYVCSFKYPQDAIRVHRSPIEIDNGKKEEKKRVNSLEVRERERDMKK